MVDPVGQSKFGNKICTIFCIFETFLNLIWFSRALRERTTAVCLSSSDEENEASDDDEWD